MTKLSIIILILTFIGWHSQAEPELFRTWGKETVDRPSIDSGWKEVKHEVRKLDDLTSAQKRAGYLLFSRNYLEPIYHSTVPYAHELSPELRTIVTQGEYEPLAFAIYALQDLKDVKIKVNPLVAESVQKISVDNIDMRIVKFVPRKLSAKDKTYDYLPFYLEKQETINIPAGSNKQIWLTLFVPPATAGGLYQGKIQVEVPGKIPSEISVKVKVLPFKLDKTKIDYMMWATDHGADTKEKWRQNLIDVVAHGCTGGSYGANIDVRRTKQPLAQLIKEAQEKFRWKIDMAKKMGLNGPSDCGIGSIGITSNWDHGIFWFVPYNFSSDRDQKALAIMKGNYEVLKQCDYIDQGYFEIAHEIGGNLGKKRQGRPNLKEMASHYYQLLRKELPATNYPGLKTIAVIGGGLAQGMPEDRWYPGVDVLCTNYLGNDPDKMMAQLKKSAKEVWFYNMSSHGELPVMDRHCFGVFSWRMEPRVMAQWVYSFDSLAKNKFRGNEGYTAKSRYPGEGNVPSIGWEAIREGIDDVKYLTTLENLIKKNPKSARAKKAQNLLDGIRKEVIIGRASYDLWSGGRAGTHPPALYDKWRWKIGKEIMALKNGK
jgi:glycosyl hydrolase family 123